jgi:hypothetical protein
VVTAEDELGVVGGHGALLGWVHAGRTRPGRAGGQFGRSLGSGGHEAAADPVRRFGAVRLMLSLPPGTEPRDG